MDVTMDSTRSVLAVGLETDIITTVSVVDHHV